MATRTQNVKYNSFLSPKLTAFLQRRASELIGIILFLIGSVLTVGILGYDSSDPSWNHSIASEASNPFGPIGAWVSDLLIQILGGTAILPGIIFIVWGWRTGRHHATSRLSIRIYTFIVALAFSTNFLAGLETIVPFQTETSLGGVVGNLCITYLLDIIRPIGFPFWPILAIIGVLSAGAITITCGVTREEGKKTLKAAALFLKRASIISFIFFLWITRNIMKLFESIRKISTKKRLLTSRSHLDEEVTSEFGYGRKTPSIDIKRSNKRIVSVADSDNGINSVSDIKLSEGKVKKPRKENKQQPLDLGRNEYAVPPIDVLDALPENRHKKGEDEDTLLENARSLETVLEDFGVHGRIVKVRPGPVVTLYELEPAPGTKSSRVISLADDVARSMSASSVRIAVVPGKNVIGIELPNLTRELVGLRELIATKDYKNHSGALTLILGKDIGGTPIIVDMARMPHLLIAGTTGSGKSVAINTMIMSLLYRLTPEQCKFIMIDPKMLELSVYDGIPHLLCPVVTDPAKAVVALRWAVQEMEDRYRGMSNLGVRNIDGYNQRIKEAIKRKEGLSRTVQTGFDPNSGEPLYEEQAYKLEPLPYIVVIVDEMADLMLVAGKEVEAAVQRLAQMARAAGIHIIMATQRPSVDVITGTIKANFPTRISFQVTSKIDSRTVLGEGGAEQLLGQGDMLYMAGGGRVNRVHGPFVSDDAVLRVVNHLHRQRKPVYLEEITEGQYKNPFIPNIDSSVNAQGKNSGDDVMYERAIEIVAREGKASTSFVQRHLQIGYNRAARIIERMEAEGIISKPNNAGKRKLLIQTGKDQ